ncbi:fibromodulin-like [Oncorhynchus masou masou]|uniref:fibromodulin-like n=1 Tax=Oncorhynchus masou masou TaxID=90313 RepID=UPI003183D312
MRGVCVFLLVCIMALSVAMPDRQDPFLWLSALHGRGYNEGSLLADTTGGECPDECDCPPSFPIAMYCDGRGLTAMPTVPSRMKYLYLQHNEITALPDSALANTTNLVWVMLHHNALSTDKIGKRVFAKLQGLERLYLQHNNLTGVPPNLPRSLRDLRLNNNNINKITPEALEGMDNLTILYLHDNTLTEMGTSLRGLNSLTLLDVSGNKLKKVPDSLPELIHQLYLESNAISAVPEGFLSKFSQLQYIRMGHNQLTDKGIPPNTFNVTGLVELDLSFNQLERIPPVSQTLEHLYLQANHIKEFTLGSFCSVVDVINFSKLRTVRLDGNEISTADVPSDSVLCLRMANTIQV